MLVLDEASQLATADLAMIAEAARQAGARVIVTGDTAQLGAVEAGGMLRLLAQEVPAAQLHEVRRFGAAWEREASVRLRAGDLAAIAAYDRHGRIRGADQEAAYDRAASMWLADRLRGKDVLLLAGSNAEAAELSRRVQARLAQLGTVGRPVAALSDGNQAGVGDLVRARLNTEIDAGGRALTNRDTLRITGFAGPDAEVRRQRLDGSWTGPFRLPRSYLARSAELAYAGNVHVAQGRTVDTAHLLVTGTLSRQALYVGMSRGRQANTAHVVTGQDTFRALEIADEQAEIRVMSRGELEARVLVGDRARATAPPDVSRQLRLTVQAEADAWQQSADARARHDQATADNASTLAAAMAGEKTRLEAANARYEQWSAGTAATRQTAGQAKAELARRGQELDARKAPEPQTMAGWWRQFQADADAMGRAIEREDQAAVGAGQPWPSARPLQPEPELHGVLQPEDPRPGQPEILTPDPDRDDGLVTQLDKLQIRAAAAAARIAADHADRDARVHYFVRIDRQAQAGPETGPQATLEDPEIEM